MEIRPVAIFRCGKKNPYEAARQGSIDSNEELGEIQFHSGQQFEQALEDLEGFSHLWLIYQFHQNETWNPKVLPPRGSSTKKGVFATRSPYRPNPLGLSCVELVEKKGLSLFVRSFDLLDETPIFDIKPYLPYSDSFPEAKTGWLQDIETAEFTVSFSPAAEQSMEWLKSQGIDQIKNFIHQQLQYEPLNKHKKRLSPASNPEGAVLCYRTWRAQFSVHGQSVLVEKIFSGYRPEELKESDDKYGDKEIHRQFLKSTY